MADVLGLALLTLHCLCMSDGGLYVYTVQYIHPASEQSGMDLISPCNICDYLGELKKNLNIFRNVTL